MLGQMGIGLVLQYMQHSTATMKAQQAVFSRSIPVRSYNPTPLLRALGEAESVVVDGEHGVGVLHEAVAEQPDVVAEAEVLARERADALAAARRADVEATKPCVSICHEQA